MLIDTSNFKDMLENLQVAIFRCSSNLQTRFLFANAKFCEMLEIKADEISKHSFGDLFVERRRYKQFHKRLMEEGVLNNFVARLKSKRKSPSIPITSANRRKSMDSSISCTGCHKKTYEK